MRTAAERRSFKMVRETCPDLDETLDDLLEDVNDLFDYDNRDELRVLFAVAAEKIKDKCTKPLREALVEMIEVENDLREEMSQLTAEKDYYRDKVLHEN